MATPHAQVLNLGGVLSESKRIINAHSRHFLALSVLFLLPLSFSVTIFPTLRHTLSSSPTQALTLLRLTLSSPREPDTTPSLRITLAYLLLVSTLSLAAVASVTFSVLHGFYGRPVKLLFALKSLSSSFLPLLATAAVANFAFLAVTLALALSAYAILGAFRHLLGFQISQSSPYFIAFAAVCFVLLALVLVFLQVNWALAGVIVVAESSWGIGPLRRSACLVKGMRRLSLSLVLFFGFFIGMLVCVSSSSSPMFVDGGSTAGWKNAAFIAQIVVTSALISVLMLHSLAAATVFYMYCKAMQGELAAEIVDEFAREYICLPFDAEKVPHIVSVIQA